MSLRTWMAARTPRRKAPAVATAPAPEWRVLLQAVSPTELRAATDGDVPRTLLLAALDPACDPVRRVQLAEELLGLAPLGSASARQLRIMLPLLLRAVDALTDPARDPAPPERVAIVAWQVAALCAKASCVEDLARMLGVVSAGPPIPSATLLESQRWICGSRDVVRVILAFLETFPASYETTTAAVRSAMQAIDAQLPP